MSAKLFYSCALALTLSAGAARAQMPDLTPQAVDVKGTKTCVQGKLTTGHWLVSILEPKGFAPYVINFEHGHAAIEMNAAAPITPEEKQRDAVVAFVTTRVLAVASSQCRREYRPNGERETWRWPAASFG